MQYWLWSTIQENWDIVKRKDVWATKDKRVTAQIKNGDILIFYVKGTLCFKGIFQATSDWYETDEIVWDDEIKENKKKHPYQINIQPIQLGEASYKDLVPRLEFVEKKLAPKAYIRGTGGGPVNFRKPIGESDYKLILDEMKKKPSAYQPPVMTPTPTPEPTPMPVPPPIHSELITMLIELGEMFRMYPEREIRSGPYQYDVVWKRLKMGNPTKVFEVQHKGVLDSALAKLKHAYDLWSASLFLIITEPKDKDRAKLLLAGSFHEIENVTTLIQPEEIKEIYEYKKRFRDIEEKLR